MLHNIHASSVDLYGSGTKPDTSNDYNYNVYTLRFGTSSKVNTVTHLNMFRLLVFTMGTLSVAGCGRNVDVFGNKSRSWFTMSEAMRSDVNGLMATVAATVAGTFFSSADGVDDELGHDGVDDADDEPPLTLLLLLLLLLALRSSG